MEVGYIMITIAEINIAHIKSMALASRDEAMLDMGIIKDNRRFYLVNSQGRLLSRRQVGGTYATDGILGRRRRKGAYAKLYH